MRWCRVLIVAGGLMLSACGGGGGRSPPPVSPAPSLQIQSIAFAKAGPVSRPMVDGTFSNVAAGGGGSGALSYQSSNTSVATVDGQGVVTFVAPGATTIMALKAADGTFASAAASYALNVTAQPAAPAAPIVTLSTAEPVPGGAVALTATSTDPQESALSYAWEFGDGALASGASASHAFAAEGEFPLRVTVTNAYGLSASAQRTVTVAWRPLPALVLQALNPRHLLGDLFFAEIDFVEPNGLAYSVSWDLGDGASDAAGSLVRHRYAVSGEYTVRVTVTNARGDSASATRLVEVAPRVPQPAPQDNLLQVYCAGPYCGAVDANTYGGSGVGIWRYHNATNAAATIDVAIDGLRAGQSGLLLFANGSRLNLFTQPGGGAVPSGFVAKTALPAADPHLIMLERNRSVFARFAPVSTTRKAGIDAQPGAVATRPRAATPSVGTTRLWRDAFDFANPHTVKAAATCAFATGRHGVIWVDDDANHAIDPLRAQRLADFLCGTHGAYARLVAMYGDFYGPPGDDRHIAETPDALQDLNVVLIRSRSDAGWLGYFHAGDLMRSQHEASSNEAVAVVLNPPSTVEAADDFTLRGAMVHELKHLLNGYRRGILRGAAHAAWLEETSAMMGEELVSAELNPRGSLDVRLRSLLSTGGLVSLIDWTGIAGGHQYAMGGMFGSFLHRRYGLDFHEYLMDVCDDDGATPASYQCIDEFIVSRGGAGFADEFARFGVSSFAHAGGPMPAHFGYAGMQVGEARLRPIYSPPDPPYANAAQFEGGSLFKATSVYYQFDFMGPGQTRFARNDVVVPAGATLMVVVNDTP